MLINPPRVRHIAQHDLAHLQRGFSEPNLQDFDVAPLYTAYQHPFLPFAEFMTHLTLIVAIRNGKQPLGEEDLELLDEEVLRVIYADQCTNNVRRPVRTEV